MAKLYQRPTSPYWWARFKTESGKTTRRSTEVPVTGGAKAKAEALDPRAPHLSDLIRLALNTGMRRGELLGLEISRIDLNNGLIHLEQQHTKNRRRRSVPINQGAHDAILGRLAFRKQHAPHSPYLFISRQGNAIGDVKNSFATAVRRAGIENFRFHDTRHTFASWLVMAGVPLMVVRDLLGHKSIKSTEIYAHLAPDNLRAGAAMLDESPKRGTK